ncbi:MAG: hypothetical protein J5865_01685, partial [Lachnospiraceae bacterium]|nr:hypothetical protein [Lachnospiraceae bacterium]
MGIKRGKNRTFCRSLWVRILACIVVFVTTYALVLPAITLDEQTASTEPGIVIETKESSAQESAEEAAKKAASDNKEEKTTEAAAEPASKEEKTTEAPTEPVTEKEKTTEAPTEPATEKEKTTEAPTEPVTEKEKTTEAPTEPATEKEKTTEAPTEPATEKEKTTEAPAETEPAEQEEEKSGEQTEETPAAQTEEPGEQIGDSSEEKAEDPSGDQTGDPTQSEAEQSSGEETQDPEDPASAEQTEDSEEQSSEPGESQTDPSETDTLPEETQTAEYPAQVFEQVIDTLRVFVDAPEGAFPAGTAMQIALVEDEQILKTITDAVEGQVKSVAAVDITFIYNEEKIEPLQPVRVSITSDVIAQAEDPCVVHLNEEGEAEIIEQKTDEELEEGPAENEVVFDAERFSIYAVVDTETITTRIITADGEAYAVSVTYDSTAEIPEGAVLDVKEILPGTEAYERYLAMIHEAAKKAQDPADENAEGVSDEPEIPYARFFDISILANDEKIEPAAPVQVEIRLADAPVQGVEEELLQVAHIPDGAETVQTVEAVVEPQDRDGSEQVISFSADSFSVYSVYKIESQGDTSALDGKTFVMVTWDPANDTGMSLTTQNKNNRLVATQVWFRHQQMIYAGDAEKPAQWTFTKVTQADVAAGTVTQAVYDNEGNIENGENVLYFISAEIDGATKYLKPENGKLTLSDTAVPLRVLTSEGYPGQVMIKNAAGTSNQDYRISHMKRERLFTGTKSESVNQNDYYTLFEVSDVNIDVQNEQHVADKVSVSSLENGETVVVYQSIWNEALKQYDIFAVDGYGNLVQVKDEGATIGWYTFEGDNGTSAIEWRFVVGWNDATDSESGYYWLQNVQTGAYLAPRALYDEDGNKIADVILPGKDPVTGEDIVAGTSPSFNYSLQLPGRANNEFDSTIIAWSKADGTEGLYYKEDPDTFYGIGIAKGIYGDADTFNFASTAEKITEQLTTAPTLDSTSMGIKITMYDYRSRTWMSNVIGSDEVSQITPNSDNLSTGTGIGDFVPGLVEKTLSENGIPVSIYTGELTKLFTDNDELVSGPTQANHLFLQSAYSETGYFEYNSALNYAYLESDGNFTVYNQLGAPDKDSVRNHGAFLPYSELKPDVYLNGKNTVDEFRIPLSPDNPRYN